MEWSDAIIAVCRGRVRHAPKDRRRGTRDGCVGRVGRTRWHDIVAARLPSHHWPQQRVLIPAVDARTGEPVVFDRHSGIDLVDAVAASTSAMTPYPIGDDRYINGGYRRS